jgi:hypothetical protein
VACSRVCSASDGPAASLPLRSNGGVEQAERDAILRQGVVLPETPTERRQLAGLEEDVRSLHRRGQPLRLRLRNFRSSADAYLASAGGPLPYMLRLHVIEEETSEHESALVDAWHELADECAGDERAFARRWRSLARRWRFDEVNDLVERHNRWYPAESGLPMDPRTGDYVLVNGRDYRLEPYDATWILERFPPSLPLATLAAP